MENEQEEKNQFLRTQWLLGEAAMERLKKARVAVFGIGGVGGYVAEALARSGVFSLDLIDKDLVSLTNLNRQIVALHSTVGRPKVDVMKERILDINPQAQVHTYQCFYLPDTRDLFDFSQYDYVVDAVDTVTAKLELISQTKQSGVPIICSMGAGNKKNPAVFEVADISQTSVCPLARVMRQECKKRSLKNVKVVYSKEKPLNFGHEAPASCAFVPSVAGLVIASEVIKDLVAPDKETTR